jgi:hypothetical protein
MPIADASKRVASRRGENMKYLVKLLVIPLILLPGFSGSSAVNAQEIRYPLCDLVIYEEMSELEDARISVDLAKSDFAAYEKIFEMIEGLWKAETIPYMAYVEAKYDRDAARLVLEQADLILERQAALVEQFQLMCNQVDRGGDTKGRDTAIDGLYLRYRRLDCEALAKSVDIAETNLEFDREYLKSIVKLRRQNNATKTQVILAELDVEREEKSLADAKRRTAKCRTDLDALESHADAPSK